MREEDIWYKEYPIIGISNGRHIWKGFFDGEGCIQVQKNKDSYILAASLIQTEE